MKKQISLCMILVIGAVFVATLSMPFRSFAKPGTEANVFASIQRQLDEILATIALIQVRIAELLREETLQQQQVVEESLTLPPVEAPSASSSDVSPQEISTSTEPVWKFVPVPTTYLGSGLVILYRLSVTAGSDNLTLSSVPYTVSYADISIKDLEVHAFTDELFSQKAYEINPVGKRRGLIQSGASISIEISDKTSSLIIPAGKTRYFELQGITSGKNVSAYTTVVGNELQEVRFE